MPRLPAALAIAALMAVPLVHAATQQKPGLWANTVKITMGGGFPQIDPAMIEQMEAAGVQLPFARPVTSNVCLSPEQVAATSLPDLNDPDSGCTSRNVRREGDQVLGELECNGDIRGRGDIRMQLQGPERYVGVSNFQGTAQGLPVTMTTDFSGRWLGADCGDLKPIGQ